MNPIELMHAGTRWSEVLHRLRLTESVRMLCGVTGRWYDPDNTDGPECLYCWRRSKWARDLTDGATVFDPATGAIATLQYAPDDPPGYGHVDLHWHASTNTEPLAGPLTLRLRRLPPAPNGKGATS